MKVIQYVANVLVVNITVHIQCKWSQWQSFNSLLW